MIDKVDATTTAVGEQRELSNNAAEAIFNHNIPDDEVSVHAPLPHHLFDSFIASIG
jgi:hypothetical protein